MNKKHMSDENVEQDEPSAASWFRTHLWVPVLAGFIVVAFIAVSYIFGAINLGNEGAQKEQDLSALYNQSLNALSTCLDQGQVAAQVTQQEYASIKDILTAAVSARYVDANNQPTDASGVLGGGRLISALQEQYPQIDQHSWQTLQTLVIGCRDEFQGKQDQIQVFAANFNKWRFTVVPLYFWVKPGFPNNDLRVVTGTGDSLYAMSALDRITRVVAVDKAIAAFDSGHLQSQDLFNNK